MSDVETLKKRASALRSATRDPNLIEFCDLILTTKIECSKCAKRRETKARAQQRWRQNRKAKQETMGDFE